MPIETISSESGEIVTLDEFKRELGIWDSAEDTRATLLLESARDFCERWGERTLRLSATRTFATNDWPCGGWTLRHPPVTAVSSITYYDADDSLQTLATSNYQVNMSEGGFAYIEYTDTATLPTLHDRQDAVIVTYTTGYSSASAAPAAAKYAIIQAGKSLISMGDVRQAERDERCAKTLLSTVSAPNYA